VQREIEKSGIATIGISIVRKYSEKVKPPRTVFLRWPFGHPLGEPFRNDQQRAVLLKTFEALYAIDTPGQIIDIPFRWRRETYPDSLVEGRKFFPGRPENKPDS